MDEYNSKIDTVSMVTMAGIYSRAKKNGVIMLSGFNTNDIAHRSLLRLARIISTQFNYKITVRMNWFKFLKARATHTLPYYVKYAYRPMKNEPIWCNEFITLVETQYQCEGIFKEL